MSHRSPLAGADLGTGSAEHGDRCGDPTIAPDEGTVPGWIRIAPPLKPLPCLSRWAASSRQALHIVTADRQRADERTATGRAESRAQAERRWTLDLLVAPSENHAAPARYHGGWSTHSRQLEPATLLLVRNPAPFDGELVPVAQMGSLLRTVWWSSRSRRSLDGQVERVPRSIATSGEQARRHAVCSAKGAVEGRLGPVATRAATRDSG